MKAIYLLPLAFTGLLSAQTWTAKSISFSDRGSFTQAQLEDVARTHSGSKVTAATLQDAAQRLVDTGYFTEVGATLGGTSDSTVVNFAVKPIPLSQMIHLGFENFVWLTHAEIESAISAKIPLFNDYLPEGSPLVEQVAEALRSALEATGIKVEVAEETVEPTLIHPSRNLEYRVSRPSVRVGNIKLAGVTPDLVPLVQKSVNDTARHPYNEGLANDLTTDLILAPLLDAGYIDASLANIALSPSPFAGAEPVSVVLSANLQPGDVYRVSRVEFGGTPLVSGELFQTMLKMHAGDIASRKVLLESLAPLDAAYRSKGYMDVIIHTGPAVDKAQHQVAYAITVTPGEQYRVHEVKAEGLDPAAKADFDRGFIMKAGELYNPAYVDNFLKNNSALRALADYTASYKAYADPDKHSVDLVMHFFRGSLQQRVTVH